MTDPVLPGHPTNAPIVDLEMLHVALSTLMTRFYIRGCPRVAAGIVSHLQQLLEHPQIRVSAAATEAYGVLLEHWKAALDHLCRDRHGVPPALESPGARRAIH